MAIRVYLWTDVSPGHAAMGWRDSAPGAKNKLYFSWWPANANNKKQQGFAYVPRRNPRNYLSDKLKESEATGTARSAKAKFTFHHLDEPAILAFWNTLMHANDDTGRFSFLRHNCSTTVAHALNEGSPGVPFPDYRIWNPRRVLQYCNAIHQAAAGSNKTERNAPKLRDLNDVTAVKVSDVGKLKVEQNTFKPAYNAVVHWDDQWQKVVDDDMF